jgi:hypothetical protein
MRPGGLWTENQLRWDRRSIATYEYRDEPGELLYRVARMEIRGGASRRAVFEAAFTGDLPRSDFQVLGSFRLTVYAHYRYENHCQIPADDDGEIVIQEDYKPRTLKLQSCGHQQGSH